MIEDPTNKPAENASLKYRLKAFLSPEAITRSEAVVVAALGFVALLMVAWLGAYILTTHIGHSADLLGRVTNLKNLRRTGDIYRPFNKEAFSYPPAAILLFFPLQWLPQAAVVFAWALLIMITFAASLYVVFRFLHPLPVALSISAACGAASFAALFWSPVRECLGWGQTSTILLLLVTADWLLVRGAPRGVLVGLATAFKIYPGIFILAWLWRRQWRPAFTALGTTALLTALACALWPRSAHTYFTHVVFGGGELAKFTVSAARSGSSSFITLLSGPPFPAHPLSAHVAYLALAGMLIVGLLAARRAWRHGCELTALVLLLITSAIAAPVAWDHYFTFVPLLLLLGFELGWRSLLARTAVVSSLLASVSWTLLREPTTRFLASTYPRFFGRNALLLTMLVVILAALIDPYTRNKMQPKESSGSHPRWKRLTGRTSNPS